MRQNREQDAAERQLQGQSIDTINQLIANNVVHNKQELLANPDGAGAWNSLRLHNQNALTFTLNKKQNEEDARTLVGMAWGDGDSREKFLNMNPEEWKPGGKFQVNEGTFKMLMNRRDVLRRDPGNDQRVNKAMSTLRKFAGDTMRQLHIYSPTGADKDPYDHFQGMLQEAIQDWVDTKKSPPSEKDIKDTIWPMLVPAVTEKTFGNWASLGLLSHEMENVRKLPEDTPQFQKFILDQREYAKQKGLSDPPDDLIRRAWVQDQLDRFFKSQGKDSARVGQ